MNELASSIVSLIQERLSRGHETMVLDLRRDDPVLLRPPRSAAAALELADAIARLSGLLQGLWPELAHELNSWSAAELSLPVVAGLASECALILSRQMGATIEVEMNQADQELGFLASYAQWLKAGEQVRESAATLSGELQRLIKQCGTSDGRRTAALRFQRDGAQVWVDRISGRGASLGRETLHQFAERISSECASPYRRHRNLLEQRLERHFAGAAARLRQRCPEIARAVEVALESKSCVGYRVASARLRGLPADVLLYIDAARACRGVTLVARRAHEEFVLENASGALFYFPPIQLLSRITFSLDGPGALLEHPRVRLPAGSPPWVHPYTGSLSKDGLASAKMLSQPAEEPMCPISKPAERWVKAQTAKTREPQCSDLCLDGQSGRVGRLQTQLSKALRAGKPPELLRMVEEIWTIARLGLTRAHERNQSAPRLQMTSSNMHYPVTSRAALAKTSLAARVFRFDPSKTDSKWRKGLQCCLHGRS